METRHEDLLRELGERVRRLREDESLTQRELASIAGLSTRFVASLEHGEGNISVARLLDLAHALGTSPAALLADEEPPRRAPRRRLVALLGLRGAGKSSVGRALAHRTGLGFIELDQQIEAAAALPLNSIFEIHGERYYRSLERETLARLLVEQPQAVLATGGGLVNERRTWELLQRNATTVWLKARPRDHWERVMAQGDTRPMRNRRNALAELETLLAQREPLYARAEHTVDTTGASVEQIAARLAEQLTLPEPHTARAQR